MHAECRSQRVRGSLLKPRAQAHWKQLQSNPLSPYQSSATRSRKRELEDRETTAAGIEPGERHSPKCQRWLPTQQNENSVSLQTATAEAVYPTPQCMMQKYAAAFPRPAQEQHSIR